MHTQKQTYMQHREDNREQDTENNREQHTDTDTEQDTEKKDTEQHTTQHTETDTNNHTQPQHRCSAHNFSTYSLDYYNEYVCIKNSNTIEIYTILK